MAQGGQNSFKDEWLTILFPTPLILVFAVIGAGSRQRSFTVIPTPYWLSLSKLSQPKIGSRCSLSASKKGGGKKSVVSPLQSVASVAVQSAWQQPRQGA